MQLPRESDTGAGRAPRAPARHVGTKRGRDPQRELRRRGLWAATDWLRDNSSLPSVACCRLTAVDDVHGAAVRLADDEARVSGLRTCGSPWACPHCAQRIAGGRVRELAAAVERWQARGGACAMVTLTMRHTRRDELPDLYDAATAAWGAVRMNRGVRDESTRSGVVGYVQKTETTWGPANGFHVHKHVLVFLDGSRDVGDALDAWKAVAWEAWRRTLERRGLEPVRDSGGLHAAIIRPGRAGEDVAAYVAKDGGPGEALRSALELAADTGKEARGANFSMWQVLGGAMGGDKTLRAVWAAWEAGSKGRRALVWTKALKRELLAEEASDDELAAAETPAVGLVKLHPDLWSWLRRGALVPALLEEAERGALRAERWAIPREDGAQAAVVAFLELWDVDPGHFTVLPLGRLRPEKVAASAPSEPPRSLLATDHPALRAAAA